LGSQTDAGFIFIPGAPGALFTGHQSGPLLFDTGIADSVTAAHFHQALGAARTLIGTFTDHGQIILQGRKLPAAQQIDPEYKEQTEEEMEGSENTHDLGWFQFRLA
jgi:hypothetical protein